MILNTGAGYCFLRVFFTALLKKKSIEETMYADLNNGGLKLLVHARIAPWPQELVGKIRTGR